MTTEDGRRRLDVTPEACKGAHEGVVVSAVEVGPARRTLEQGVPHKGDALPHLPRLFAGVTTGPLVLIAGRFDEADAATIGPLAAHSTLPILVATAPVGAALNHARHAGWHTMTLSEEIGLGVGWSAAVSHGVGHAAG